MIKVSLIASSVRYQLYESLFNSLKETSVKYDVIFAGNCEIDDWEPNRFGDNDTFVYIRTKNIKPAQCYEIARRFSKAETVLWTADDCEFPNDVVGKAYTYWKSQNNKKLILSIQTKESGYRLPEGQLFEMKNHTLIANDRTTPLMAPLALMSREYLQELGGFDRRYICGQYENDVVMNALADGGKVEIFGGEDCFIDIDHYGKSIKIGECTNEEDFLNRPFATGYKNDRAVLLKTWCNFKFKLKLFNHGGKTYANTFWLEEGKLRAVNICSERVDKFEPYEDKDILTKSQSNKGKWE